METITLLTAWANMHLTGAGCSCDNILTGLLEGERMRALLESKSSEIFSMWCMYMYV